MLVVDIENIWNNIIKNEGNEFSTKTGKLFTYTMLSDNTISLTHKSHPRAKCYISKNCFEIAITRFPLNKTTQLNDLEGYPYIFGILTDTRIV